MRRQRRAARLTLAAAIISAVPSLAATIPAGAATQQLAPAGPTTWPSTLTPLSVPLGQAATTGRRVQPLVDCNESGGLSGLTRADVVARGKRWVDVAVPYDQNACHTDYGQRTYRTDCSGFVSMSWGLADSYRTDDFKSDTSRWTTIGWDDLEPGDALVRPYADGVSGHIVLFVKWTSGHTELLDYEESGGDNGSVPTISRTRTVSSAKAANYHPIRYTKLAPTIEEGDFVQVSGTSAVYRIAGGAPLYVSAWAKVSDVSSPSVKVISQAAFNALAPFPKDGTFLSEGDGDAAWRVAGGAPMKIDNWAKFPAGSAAKAIDVDDRNITEAGTGSFTRTRAVPFNGTFLGDATSDNAWITVGGAPMRIFDWGLYPAGSAAKAVEIDPDNVTGAGGKGYGLVRYPFNGAFIGDGSSSAAYRVAGGAPLQLHDWNTYTDDQRASVVEVDPRNFAGPNLRSVPSDGTFLSDKDSSRAWVTAGGAALPISNWGIYTAAQKASVVEVDDYALTPDGLRAGHLRAMPADGTFIAAATTTSTSREVFRVIGGAPLYVPTLQPYGSPTITVVNQVDVLSAGTAPYTALRFYPADGTLLQTTGGAKYQVSGGRAVAYSGSAAVPASNTVDPAVIANAGGAYPYDHLAK